MTRAVTGRDSVIAIPGAEFSANQQLSVFAQLHERDADVCLVDADPADADENISSDWRNAGKVEFAQRVSRICEAIDRQAETGRRVHLFGIGLGAALAVASAAARPKTVHSLTSVCGWARSDARLRELIDLAVSSWREDPELCRRQSSLLEISAQYIHNLGLMYSPATPVVPQAGPRTLRRFAAAYDVDVRREAQAVRCPTLIVAATRDQKVPPELSYELTGLIPEAALLRAETGHGALTERLGQVYSTHLRMIRGEIGPGELVSAVQA